ncbi:unnamed protein product [Tetraodon nigroviridis]|uniref:Hexosyltransferase n=1 Tax=Tetraodon nigroviridis TaxID=99883 RepID=Q4TAG0_TETNG|nr:unnamed protein product [Tetraodon nigroviridis]
MGFSFVFYTNVLEHSWKPEWWISLQNQTLVSPNWTLSSSGSSAFPHNLAPTQETHRTSTNPSQTSAAPTPVPGEAAEELQQQLVEESREHGDLVQGDFLDCYKNLTIKTMVMLEWLQAHCSGASYAMKIDSDTFLNVPNLIRMLADAPTSNYMTGLVARNGPVLRDPNSKWYLPAEVYPDPVYPPYALGLGYVLSMDLPPKLLEASRQVRAVYIEDVYLGMCLQFLGLSPTDPPRGGYFQVFPVAYSRCAYSTLIATTADNQDRVKVWEDFKRPGPPC